MAATLEELRQLAREADKRGDRETAAMAMQKIVDMQGHPEEQVASKPASLTGTSGAAATKGLFGIIGIPGQVGRNLENLGIAGYGMARQLVGRAMGESPSEAASHAPMPVESDDFPGTPEWLANKLKEAGGTTTYGQKEHPYLSKAVEFGTQAAVLGPSAGLGALRPTLYGAASGLGSQGGGDIAQSMGGPQARPYGELAGSVVAPVGLGLSEGTLRALANQRPASKVALAYRRGQRVPENKLAESQFKDIQKETGQRALLGQRLPGSEIRSLESLTAKDAASLQKLHTVEQGNIQKSFDLLDQAVRSPSKFGSDAVAGRVLRRSLDNTRSSMVNLMNVTADKMFGGLRRMVTKMGYGTRDIIKYKNARSVFNKFINTAEQNGATPAHLRNLIKQRDLYFGDSPFAVSMKNRQLINRAARGDINLFSGSRILTKGDSVALAENLAKASEKDMENSIKSAFGEDSPIYSEWRKANNVYRGHINQINNFDNTVLGKMIGKPVSNITDFSKKFLSLAPEERSRVVKILGPNEKEAIARYKLDSARKSAIDLSGKGTAGERFVLPNGEQANMSPTKFLDAIGDRKDFVSLFPKEQQPRVDKIIKGLERQADRLGTTGGSANELSREQSYVGSGVGGLAGNKQSLIFLTRQLYADIFRGSLSKLLFTKEGQEKVLKRLQNIESRKSIPKTVQLVGSTGIINRGK